MSGVRTRHLERRCGIFGVRVRVPDDIRPLIGRVEVRRSLRTSDFLKARAQAALIAMRLLEVFEMARECRDHVTEEDIWNVIGRVFEEVGRNLRRGELAELAPPVQIAVRAKPRVGPTVGEAISAYLATKKPAWTDKTYVDRSRKLKLLEEHLGAGTPLSLVSAEDVRGFRDGVLRLRANKGAASLQSFASRQTDSILHRIDGKTASLTFEPAKAFFRWCKADQGYIACSPAEDIRIALPKKPKGTKPRRPFSKEELTMLFSSPMFTGCLSKSRRFERGSLILQDAKFWLPVLGYYTGARLGELVQLHIRDVEVSGPIPFLHITEEHAGNAGTNEAKHVKSEAGVRRVPIHPDLVELGFIAFVEGRRRQKRSSRRLFHEIGFGADGQASTVFSKFFGRLLDKVGLPDPALVFHSFRHGAEDAFRNSLQPQYVIDRIIGHSNGASSAGYGHGVSIEVAHEAVSGMKLDVSLPKLWSTRGGCASST